MDIRNKTSVHRDFTQMFGREIARLRRDKQLSGKQLGKMVGISQQQISRYENGVCEITLTTLCSLLHHLDVSLDDFFSSFAINLEHYKTDAYSKYSSLFKSVGGRSEFCVTLI